MGDTDVDGSVMGSVFFFQAEDGMRDVESPRGLGDVYKGRENAEHVQLGLQLMFYFVLAS